MPGLVRTGSITPGTPAYMRLAFVVERDGATYYTDFSLPATFAFQTRKGDRGILQVIRFTEAPRGIRIRYKLVQNSRSGTPMPDNAGQPSQDVRHGVPDLPSAAKPTPGTTSLADAVSVFNARAAHNSVGKNQPPLTEEEVIAAIRWSLLDPDKLLASFNTLQILKKITYSRELPQGFELEVLTRFQPNEYMEVAKWSVRLRIPAIEPGHTTCVSIREQPISSRLFGEEERKVIDKRRKKWKAEGILLGPDGEYEAERAKAAEIDRSKQTPDKQPNAENPKSGKTTAPEPATAKPEAK
jgi:hypothetical protein